MSEASLAAQKLLLQRMKAYAPLTALVGNSIFDRNGRPTVFPSIIFGEAQTVGDDIDCADLSDVYMTLHVWTKEEGLVLCKQIAGEIRRALRRAEGVVDGFSLDVSFEDARFLRDPSGEHSHGVVTFNVTAEDTVGIT